MIRVHILYRQFFDPRGEQLLIGGVETYLRNLACILREDGYLPLIYQFASEPFRRDCGQFEVIGVASEKKCNSFRPLIRQAEAAGDLDRDILIFGADICIEKTKFRKVVSIQHGIGWDVHLNVSTGYQAIKFYLRNALVAVEKARSYAYCTKVVCVDYNFLNWYRTMTATGVDKLKVIPNFTEVPPLCEKDPGNPVSIIFARRFQEFRGTRIFAKAIENLIARHPDLSVCIAGEGPDAEWLHQHLDQYKQVRFTKFHPNDSVQVHQQFDIAVVPSLGSEGTSLSLLEAMASGCAVVCTNIGGLTNIVIDGYNGLITEPNESDLEHALGLLIENGELREKLSQKGYETVRQAFSFEVWKRKWLEVMDSL